LAAAEGASGWLYGIPHNKTQEHTCILRSVKNINDIELSICDLVNANRVEIAICSGESRRDAANTNK
jgi:predicted NAD/FAD-dependent oxidoreductase